MSHKFLSQEERAEIANDYGLTTTGDSLTVFEELLASHEAADAMLTDAKQDLVALTERYRQIDVLMKEQLAERDRRIQELELALRNMVVLARPLHLREETQIIEARAALGGNR